MLTASEFGVSIQTSPFKQRTFKFGLIDASRTSTTYLQHAYRFLLFVLESDSGNDFHDDQHLTRLFIESTAGSRTFAARIVATI